MYKYIYLILVFSVCTSYGIIYQLNDTEYEQLPILFELDDYDSCLDNSGVYCLATLELYGKPDNKIYSLIQEYSQHYVKHFNYSNLDRGVCVTKTCENYIINNGLDIDDDLELILEGCLNEKIKLKYNLDTKIQEVTCERKKNEWDHIDAADYAVAAVIIALCVSVILGSYYDLNHKVENDEYLGTGHKTLLCFSIFRSAKRLFYISKNAHPDRWNLFDGSRVIFQILIIYGHTLYLFGGFTANPHDFEKSYDHPFQRLVYSSTGIIQKFFFMTGLLLVYNLLKAEETQQLSWKKIQGIIFVRWCRLTIVLAILLAFLATWFRHLGSGPIWKRQIVNGVSSQCRTFYWAHVFYFNNYLPDDYLCSMESWYLAADMQLFIFTLIVHFVIRKRSWRTKLVTLMLLVVIGIISPIFYVYLQNLDAFAMLKPEGYRTLLNPTFQFYHKYPSNNITCYAMGMGTGYLAYYIKQRKLVLPKSIVKLGYFMNIFLIPALFYIFVVGTSFYDDKISSLTSRVLFASSHRVVMGISMIIFTLAVLFDMNLISKYLLEWSGWKIPSRLSYCAFLIHNNILHYLMGSRTHLVRYSMLNGVYAYLGVLLLSQLFAIILYLLVEEPANQLIKIFMSNSKKQKAT